MALSGLAISSLGLRPALASPASAERKFLFLFARGGWDYSYVFAPLFDNSWVDPDPESTAAEAHGVPFVDAESRPAVREFFENYGNRACIINGMEVRSITHSVCTRLVFTGTSRANADDFGSIIAAHSSQDLLLPHMVLSGPSYGYDYASQIVRMGPDGQLPALLDGSAMGVLELSGTMPGIESEALIQAYVRDRARIMADQQNPGWAGRVQSLHLDTLEKLDRLESGGFELSFDSLGLAGQIADAMTLLSLGLSRCVTVQHDGLYDLGWDSHATNSHQDSHFQLYFEVVNEVMATLDSMTSLSGNPLSDEVTVVLVSEMGRDPRLNAQEGKHHWTHTSCMVVGSGVQGGQTIGAFDENVSSSPVELSTGEVHSNGTYLLPAHLGATLLALGDVDSGPYLGDAQPIEGLLK
jgi:hypothetical protein